MYKLITVLLFTSVVATGCVFGGQTPPAEKNDEPVSQIDETADLPPAIEAQEEIFFDIEEIDTSGLSSDLSPETLAQGEALAQEGWKTYRNEEFGFEFQYSGNWIFYNIKEVNADGTFEYLYDKKVNNKIIFLNKKFVNKGLGAPVLTVSIVDLNGNFQNYINSIFKECNNIKNTKIDEVEFIKLECEGYADPNYYVGTKDKKIYTFSSIGGMNPYLDIIIDSLVIK